jgi:hypothetical protein
MNRYLHIYIYTYVHIHIHIHIHIHYTYAYTYIYTHRQYHGHGHGLNIDIDMDPEISRHHRTARSVTAGKLMSALESHGYLDPGFSHDVFTWLQGIPSGKR